MTSYYIDDQNVSARWSLSAPNSAAYKFINGRNPVASPSYANNPTKLIAGEEYSELPFGGMGAIVWPPSTLITGVLTEHEDQYFDYHFRFWVIPDIFTLTNPQLSVDIPFKIWNTFPRTEALLSTTVTGSAVLTFDINPGDTLYDHEQLTVNMQIGAGEPTIEALIEFIFTSGSGFLTVIALVSDTFNLIPDVPIKETWEFKTNILTTYRGDEQRIALRRFPRIKQQFTSFIKDQTARHQQYNLMKNNIAVQSLVPFYQYGTNLTAGASLGDNRIFFDPSKSNIRAGEFMIVVNPVSGDVHITKVLTVEVDGATMNTVVGFPMTTFWIVAPALTCLINNGSGLDMQNVSGTLSITADSFTEPTLLRPNATRNVGLIDGIPWLDRRPLINADEKFSYVREILDNEVGKRELRSRHIHPRVSGNRKFIIRRLTDPEEMDYWRSFFDTLRGSQKAFLLSTWFKDLTLSSLYAPGAASISINEDYYAATYFPYGTWKYIQFEFENNITTQHLVTSVVVSPGSVVNFTPPLPLGDAYLIPKKISFLQKWRATDRVVFNHYANYTEVSFGVISSDD